MPVRKLDPTNKTDVNKWVKFPFDLYRDHKLWVPPLIGGEKNSLNPNKHPFYTHSTADFFLAEEKGKTLGRIALLHNTRYIEYTKEKAGHFAFFEVVEDIKVARALFETAFEWCAKKGFNLLYGPKGMIGADASGVLVEGFEHRPAINVPYNYPYYDEFIRDSGFIKERDNFSGYFNAVEIELPERVQKLARRVKDRKSYYIKKFKNKAELVAMIPEVREVHHQAFSQVYGYYPHTDVEYRYVIDQLISIVDPQLIKLVMKDNKVIGFLFAYHDVSAGLQKAKGRMFPFGWLHILLDKRKTEWVNLNGAGILPEYQGLGSNTVLYLEMTETVKSYNFKHAETVLVGEENYRSFSDNVSMGVAWYKTHRLYKKNL